MPNTFRYYLNRIREKLWFRPIVICILSIVAVFTAKLVDGVDIPFNVPEIAEESVDSLLDILASSMLVIAVFAMGAMISAYSSASRTATPRSFPLIIADDISQYALSAFIGAFIFSVVAQITFENSYFGPQGRFALLVLTLFVFTIVILTLLKWVDRIARLGRIATTIEMVECATDDAIRKCRWEYSDESAPDVGEEPAGEPVFGEPIGYIQHIDLAGLESFVDEADADIHVRALPGAFVTPERPLAIVSGNAEGDEVARKVAEFFIIGQARSFEQDPRFGLIVLSEIASRAMSTSVNDPGTAIAAIGSLVRLFSAFAEMLSAPDNQPAGDSRVKLPVIYLDDLFDDAFGAIARDGAATVEVAVRLLKALNAIAELNAGELSAAAQRMAHVAHARALENLDFNADIQTLNAAAQFMGRQK